MADQGDDRNSYAVDIVMCIDGSKSMGDMLNSIERFSTELYACALVGAERCGEHIRDDWFRVKVIVFRDYKADGDRAMQESEFFNLTTPEGRSGFERFVRGIEPRGGGDTPENALEAIYLALKSDWVDRGRYRRHAIVLFTDAPALQLHDPQRTTHPDYPIEAPDSLYGLKDMIDKYNSPEMSYSGKYGRMIVFAPENCGWDWVRMLNCGYLLPTRPDGGIEEVDFDQVFSLLFGDF